MTRWTAGLIGLTLAACTGPPPSEPPFPGQEPSAPAQATPTLNWSPPPDACGAYELQSLIGKPRTEVPVAIDPGRQRVACTTCPLGGEDDPERLNFLFDADTGLIKQIRCG